MSITQLHAPHGWRRATPGRPRRGRAFRFVENAVAAVRDWRRRERERGELEVLDERTLHDIGLSRSDALYLTTKPADDDAWRISLRYPPY
jgi:uncharacterized protein YjiS (DUF1127 family)